jgi:cytochrome c-type biogenesis protein CcmH/NrfG
MMTTATKPTNPGTARSMEATLLARLGLPAGASSQDVETAHDALVDFLGSAPSELKGWARQQVGTADEAYALLSDPTIDRSSLAADIAQEPTAAPATTVAKVSVGKVMPVAHPAAATGNRGLKRLAIGAAALAGVAVIVIAGFNLNGGTGVPPINGSPAPEAAASQGVDAAKVATLMQKIQANPKDTAALQSLADVYYQASDYSTAGSFLEKILQVDPKNVVAMLALGATQFNVGDSAGAEKQWLAVAAIDPKNVEAHYDLGFMYLSQNPPDMAKVKAEWGKVIAVDPNSDVAKTVAKHLASLAGSPAPSGSTAPASTTPSASPAASAAPSASLAPSAK